MFHVKHPSSINSVAAKEAHLHECKEDLPVGISGSYGGMNLGDEAILQAMVAQLREAAQVEITVFSKNPEDTLRRHDAERAIPVRKLSRDEVLPEIEGLDLLMLGGGGILFDGEVKQYLREVALAHEKGVPVMTCGIGAGPLNDSNNQRLVKENPDRTALATVRERSAKKVLGIDVWDLTYAERARRAQTRQIAAFLKSVFRASSMP